MGLGALAPGQRWSASRKRDVVLRLLRGVDLVRLVELAPQHRQVPDLFEAYIRRCPPVSLPDFLGALSVLLAKGALRAL